MITIPNLLQYLIVIFSLADMGLSFYFWCKSSKPRPFYAWLKAVKGFVFLSFSIIYLVNIIGVYPLGLNKADFGTIFVRPAIFLVVAIELAGALYRHRTEFSHDKLG
jgi:hypothetical protein